mmetsp:Transcript_8034/g.20265  ORF Transcript_8034/g.20265 Transcript_8034/m.20265 type:complete len:124 (+) Transcript_8034:120-491(+)
MTTSSSGAIRWNADLKRKAYEDWKPKVGEEVHIHRKKETITVRRGVCRWIGNNPHFTNKGENEEDEWWVGVELDTAVGKHDGSVNGVRYFTCPDNCGLFVKLKNCEPTKPPKPRKKSTCCREI